MASSMIHDLEQTMKSLKVTENRCKFYEEHKTGSPNCDITFGFSIKSDPYMSEMETEDIPSRVIVYSHKKLLREASPMFDMLLNTHWNVEGPVEILELTAAQFIKFLEILYLEMAEEINSIEETMILLGFGMKYRCEKVVFLLSNYILDQLFNSMDTKIFYVLLQSLPELPNPLIEEACLEFLIHFTQVVIDSEHFLYATPQTIEIIYKQDIMNIPNELFLVKALEKYVVEHEKRGVTDIKQQVKRAIGSIRFQILDEKQILETILLTDDEKAIFVTLLKDQSKYGTLPIHFTRKIRNRYDARFIGFSSMDVFHLMTNFYRCMSSECANVVCPSFTIGPDFPNILPEYAEKFTQIMTELKVLQNIYNGGQQEAHVVEEILQQLYELQCCFEETKNDTE